jgi:hypothetical protein
MFRASIPTHYWPEMFESVVFTINRIPSAAVSFSTPYNILFHKTPDFNFFKVLGCLCYPYTRPYAPNKLSPRSHPCVLIGYSNVYKGYKCLNLTTNKIYLSRHVIFDENSFPFKHLSTHTSLSSLPINPSTAAPLVVLQQSLPTTSISTDSFTSTSLSQPTTPPQFPLLPAPPLSHNSSLPPPITKVYQRKQFHTAVPSSNNTIPASQSSHHMLTR